MPTITQIETAYPILTNSIKSLFAAQSPPVDYTAYMNNLIDLGYQDLSPTVLGNRYEYGVQLWVASRLANLLTTAGSGGAYAQIEVSRNVPGEYGVTYASPFQGRSLSVTDVFNNQYSIELEALLRSLTVGFIVSEP